MKSGKDTTSETQTTRWAIQRVVGRLRSGACWNCAAARSAEHASGANLARPAVSRPSLSRVRYPCMLRGQPSRLEGRRDQAAIRAQSTVRRRRRQRKQICLRRVTRLRLPECGVRRETGAGVAARQSGELRGCACTDAHGGLQGQRRKEMIQSDEEGNGSRGHSAVIRTDAARWTAGAKHARAGHGPATLDRAVVIMEAWVVTAVAGGGRDGDGLGLAWQLAKARVELLLRSSAVGEQVESCGLPRSTQSATGHGGATMTRSASKLAGKRGTPESPQNRRTATVRE